jgi:hypothetical protein
MAKGLALAAGGLLLAPMALPVCAALARPLGRAAVRSGSILYEKGRETAAELGEVLDDFLAEASEELAKRRGDDEESAESENEDSAEAQVQQQVGAAA